MDYLLEVKTETRSYFINKDLNHTWIVVTEPSGQKHYFSYIPVESNKKGDITLKKHITEENLKTLLDLKANFEHEPLHYSLFNKPYSELTMDIKGNITEQQYISMQCANTTHRFLQEIGINELNGLINPGIGLTCHEALSKFGIMGIIAGGIIAGIFLPTVAVHVIVKVLLGAGIGGWLGEIFDKQIGSSTHSKTEQF